MTAGNGPGAILNREKDYNDKKIKAKTKTENPG